MTKIAFLVNVFMERTTRCPHAQVIDPFSLTGNIANQVVQALSTSELCDHHGEKLTPAIEGAEFLPSMMFAGQVFKIMSREK